MNALALPMTVADIVSEYDTKEAAVESAVAELSDAFQRFKSAGTVQGTFVEPLASEPFVHVSSIRKALLKSGWKAVYNKLQIDRIASAKDKQLFERTIADPPPLTFANAKATFGDYFERPRFHILRGVAEVFAELDPAYKSHSKVRIGVKGLPKRIILNGWGCHSYGYARDKFRDIVNALAAYQGKLPFAHSEMLEIQEAHDRGEDAIVGDRGITVRKFGNGNAHLFFDQWALLDINRALAEFYGEVLPDVEEDGPKRPGTDLAKDLQFYWSPLPVIHAALEFAGIHSSDNYCGRPPSYRVLEPSCGDGRILDELRARGHSALGFECHAGRAAEARAKAHAVVTGNFLEQSPVAEFDKVVMNPPFYGRHYVKHVRHALKFLKPGGGLVSILPATAHYDHGELSGEWRDLPVGSFADAGTNVPTGLLRIRGEGA